MSFKPTWTISVNFYTTSNWLISELISVQRRNWKNESWKMSFHEALTRLKKISQPQTLISILTTEGRVRGRSASVDGESERDANY